MLSDMRKPIRNMTSEQFRDAISRLSLTQGQAAKLFDVNLRTVNRWATGAWPIPKVVAIAVSALSLAKDGTLRIG